MSNDDDLDIRIGKVLYGFVDEFLKQTGKELKNFFKINKFGLLPQGMDYSDIESSMKSKKQLINQIIFLIGKPKTFQALLAGIHLNSLSSAERKKNYSKFKEIVHDKFQSEGIVVFNMGATGFIKAYVKLLTEESIEENLSQKERIENFEDIVKDWEERSFFVDSSKTELIVTRICRRRMEFGKSIFFIFAGGKEIQKTKNSIKILIKNNIHKDLDYVVRPHYLNSKKTECVWFFRKKNLFELK